MREFEAVQEIYTMPHASKPREPMGQEDVALRKSMGSLPGPTESDFFRFTCLCLVYTQTRPVWDWYIYRSIGLGHFRGLSGAAVLWQSHGSCLGHLASLGRSFWVN